MKCEACNQEIRLRRMEGSSIFRKSCVCPEFNYIPKTRATIIVPSKYPDIFDRCKISLNKYAPKENKILVRDGSAIESPSGWKTIQAPDKPFSFSRNVNLGIKESGNGDILICNDDVVFTSHHTVETMQALFDSNPKLGIISPFIDGAGTGEYWQTHCTTKLQYTEVRLCFVCVLIRREVIDKVGLMDERIGLDGSYGYDDVEYCRRTVNAGYKLGVTSWARVWHGLEDATGGNWSTSFKREKNLSMSERDKIAQKQYFDIYGDLSLECKGE